MDRNDDKNRKPGNESDRDLPGYPHYPPDEDIMNPQSGFRKISADEELANNRSLSSRSVQDRSADDAPDLRDTDNDQEPADDDTVRVAGRVDDVNDEEELDIPGADLDDENEELGEEDEENNYYSLGGDRHDNLEEDQS